MHINLDQITIVLIIAQELIYINYCQLHYCAQINLHINLHQVTSLFAISRRNISDYPRDSKIKILVLRNVKRTITPQFET